MRPCDNLWAQERAPVGIELLDDVLAGDLQRPISLAADLGHILAGGRHSRVRLIDGAMVRVAIYADSADEYVSLHVIAQHFGAWATLPRRVAAHVHARVPS